MRPASPCIALLPSHDTAPTRDHGARYQAPPPSLVSSVAGVWEGVLYPDSDEVGLAFSLLQNALVPIVASSSLASSSAPKSVTARGATVGHVAFAASDDAVAAPVHILEASATTYVALVGPYYDARLDTPVVMVLEGRRSGERMWGSYRIRPSAANASASEDRSGNGGCFVAVKAMRAAA